MPMSIEIFGLKFNSLLLSTIFAEVLATSPGWIGKRFLLALIFSFFSIIDINLVKLSGLLLPILYTKFLL